MKRQLRTAGTCFAAATLAALVIAGCGIEPQAWRARQAAGDWICLSRMGHSAWRLQTGASVPGWSLHALDSGSRSGAMRSIMFVSEKQETLTGVMGWGTRDEPDVKNMRPAVLQFPAPDTGILFVLNDDPHRCHRLPRDHGFDVLADAARALGTGGESLRSRETGFEQVLEETWQEATGAAG